MTPIERYHQRLREIGCIACIMVLGVRETPCEVHHLFDAHQRNDWLCVGLCAGHHRGVPGVVGFHPGGERRFRAAYGIGEVDLLSRTIAEIERGR